MIWLGALALLGALGAAWLGYRGWFLRQTAGAFPFCRVELLEAKDMVSSANVTLVGTSRTYKLVRLTHEGDPNGGRLPTPTGFELETDHELDDATSWIPEEDVRFVPNKPVRLSLPFDSNSTEAIRVTGWIETKIGRGGSGAFFNVPVGPVAPAWRELLNLESRVRAEAVSRGIRPVDHSEWAEVLRRRDHLTDQP